MEETNWKKFELELRIKMNDVIIDTETRAVATDAVALTHFRMLSYFDIPFGRYSHNRDYLRRAYSLHCAEDGTKCKEGDIIG